MTEQTNKQAPRAATADELSDQDLAKVSAGSRPNCSAPFNPNNASASDSFAKKN